MAFYDSEDEDDQSANASAPGAQAQSGSSVITGGGTGGTSSPKANTPDRPGNFVNLQQYLTANKSQAGKLGDQASGVINQSADQARQGVTSLNQEASQKIQPVQNLSSDVSGKLQSGAETLSPEERAQIKSTQAASYTGPQSYTDLNSYQSASDANQKATQNVANSGTEQGRMSLISQINSKPRTQGMTVFDNALLQSGGGRQKLAQTAEANKGLAGEFGNATQGIQGQIGRADDPSTPDVDESAGAIGQTNAAQKDAYKKVQDALSGWTSGFQPKVAEAQKNLTDMQNRVTSDIGNDPYKLDEETMKLLGLGANTRVFDNDLNSYLNQASPSDINAANVASPEDYARYAALADLSGDQSNILDQKNIGMAGKAPSLTANTAKLQEDILASQTKYDKNYKSATDAVRNQFAPNPDQYPGASMIYAELAGKSPEWLETVGIPNLLNRSGSGYQVAAAALSGSLADWKKDQGYNKIVNSTAAPNLPVVTGSPTGQVDWGQFTRPEGK